MAKEFARRCSIWLRLGHRQIAFVSGLCICAQQ